MWYAVFKLAVSAVVIYLVSETARRSAMLGGFLASLPVISYLGMMWLYIDTGDKKLVAELSWRILWLVIPSLSFFVAMPLLLKKNSFVVSLLLSTLVMFACYGGVLLVLRRFGITN